MTRRGMLGKHSKSSPIKVMAASRVVQLVFLADFITFTGFRAYESIYQEA